MDLFRHYLKVAFRNLLKYKLQAVISTLGLAAGFTCFALSAVWIRYEMTYDTFHEGAERMYLVESKRYMDRSGSGYTRSVPYPLAEYLKKKYPEVEEACPVRNMEMEIFYEEVTLKESVLSVDSLFLRMFKVDLLEGNYDFLLKGSQKVAITQRFSNKLFGPQSPLGKKIKILNAEWEICAVIIDWSEHSNISFDLIYNNPFFDASNTQWRAGSCQVFMKLRENVDESAFQEKLKDLVIDNKHFTFRTIPLPKIRTEVPMTEIKIKFQYVRFFALVGLLVIVCALLNLITLYISRFQVRTKEFSIRMICGSSKKTFFSLLITEVFIWLLPAIILGLASMEVLIPAFKKLAIVQTSNVYIWSGLMSFLVGVLLCAFIFCCIPIWSIGRKTFAKSLVRNVKNQNRLRKLSICFQIAISIGIIFSAGIMMKQLHFLKHTDLGLSRHNIAAVYVKNRSLRDGIAEQFKHESVITEVLSGHESLFPESGGFLSWNVSQWDGNTKDQELVNLRVFHDGEPLCRFYDIQMVEGEMLKDAHASEDVMISESTARAFGWDKAVGKTFILGKTYTVVGVCTDLYMSSPAMPLENIVFVKPFSTSYQNILIKYQEGRWEECKKVIERIAGDQLQKISNAEEAYAENLASENALLKLLEIISVVCVLIAVFGIYSLVTLSCEQRRKEIAIRKVNGATVKDILDLFVKEYLWLLGLSALVAFPVGTIIMKRWMEHYTLQTTMSAWVYIAIFLGIVFVVALSIGKIVLTAARQNPADVIRTE